MSGPMMVWSRQATTNVCHLAINRGERDNAAFIAAANPARVLALLAENAALRGQLIESSVVEGQAHALRLQAERQRDEAVAAAKKLSAAISWTDYPFIDSNTGRDEIVSRLGFMQKDADQPRAFLASLTADHVSDPRQMVSPPPAGEE